MNQPRPPHESSTDTVSVPANDMQQRLERTRRRFARRQWARRWRVWRVAVISAVVAVSLAIGIWLVYFSSVLAVDSVEISGTDALTQAQVRQVANVPMGDPLIGVDLGAISARVGDLRAVKHVEVSRRWPHTVVVSITERKAVAIVAFGSLWRGIDAEGVLFRDYDAPLPALPKIQIDRSGSSTTGLPDDDVLAEAATVAGSLPGVVLRRIDHVTVASVDQITLTLRDGRQVVWGSADRSAEKARVLTVMLTKSKVTSKARYFDVSVPGQPTIRR